MKSFSFIHTGDLHLDSPFKGVSTQSSAVADALRSATFEAFEALVRLCIDEQVQFLLVTGDVYDGIDRSLRAQLKFIDGLKILSEHNIPSFVVHGNHDPMGRWSSMIEWPSQVHIFGPNKVETKTVKIIDEPIASVSGISYNKQKDRRNLAQKFKANNPDLFQIAMLHCNCGGDPNHKAYAPCRLSDLTGAGFDYWALGHVHEKRILSTSPYVVYPGNPQGLSIRESDERGCYIVSVNEDKKVEIKFCPIDIIRWISIEIKIDDISSVNGLDRKIAEIIDDLREEYDGGRSVICRIILTGRGPLYRELRQENIVADFLERAQAIGLSDVPFVWVQDIDVNCQPEIDLEKRRNINDLLGQILKVSKEIRDLFPDNEDDCLALKDVLIPALSELYENTRIAKLLEPLSPDDLKRLIREAELMCIDFFETE